MQCRRDAMAYSGCTHMDICMMDTTIFWIDIVTIIGTSRVLTQVSYLGIAIGVKRNKYTYICSVS